MTEIGLGVMLGFRHSHTCRARRVIVTSYQLLGASRYHCSGYSLISGGEDEHHMYHRKFRVLAYLAYVSPSYGDESKSRNESETAKRKPMKRNERSSQRFCHFGCYRILQGRHRQQVVQLLYCRDQGGQRAVAV
jgi:hypothetical protein